VLPNNMCVQSILLKCRSFHVNTSEGCGKFLESVETTSETVGIVNRLSVEMIVKCDLIS